MKKYTPCLFLLCAAVSLCRCAGPLTERVPSGGTTTTTVIPISTNADLSTLTVSAGTLNPVFKAETTVYTVDVENAVSSITVTGKTADAGASVWYSTVQPANLNVGANVIIVRVTAKDLKTVKTYTVTVNRMGATNADLSSIQVSGFPLSPAFDPGITAYTVEVANSMPTVTLVGTASDTNGTITYIPSQSIALAIGANNAIIRVTAQDKTTVKDYNLTINRDLSDNTVALSYLTQIKGTYNSWVFSEVSGWMQVPDNGVVLDDASIVMSDVTVYPPSGPDKSRLFADAGQIWTEVLQNGVYSVVYLYDYRKEFSLDIMSSILWLKADATDTNTLSASVDKSQAAANGVLAFFPSSFADYIVPSNIGQGATLMPGYMINCRQVNLTDLGGGSSGFVTFGVKKGTSVVAYGGVNFPQPGVSQAAVWENGTVTLIGSGTIERGAEINGTEYLWSSSSWSVWKDRIPISTPVPPGLQGLTSINWIYQYKGEAVVCCNGWLRSDSVSNGMVYDERPLLYYPDTGDIVVWQIPPAFDGMWFTSLNSGMDNSGKLIITCTRLNDSSASDGRRIECYWEDGVFHDGRYTP